MMMKREHSQLNLGAIKPMKKERSIVTYLHATSQVTIFSFINFYDQSVCATVLISLIISLFLIISFPFCTDLPLLFSNYILNYLIGGKDSGGIMAIIKLPVKSMVSLGTREFRNFIDCDVKLHDRT